MSGSGLARFVEAQAGWEYELALDEIRTGEKRSHWMWFIFPQIAGLGHSPTARRFAIADRAEAAAYLAHPVLGPRLIDATRAMLDWAGKRSARAILGEIDALKLRSSMTLFEAAAQVDSPFAAAIEGFYGGERDPATLARL